MPTRRGPDAVAVELTRGAFPLKAIRASGCQIGEGCVSHGAFAVPLNPQG